MLVCQHPELVDLMLANLFHFHYSCPILGSGGYPEPVFADMMARLKRNPELAVFVLHDLTPAGLSFADRVREQDRWFADRPQARIIDLGLLLEQRRFFNRLLRPLSEIPGAVVGGAAVSGLPAGLGAEIFVFRPELLTKLLAGSLQAEVPFHLIPVPPATDGSGYG